MAKAPASAIAEKTMAAAPTVESMTPGDTAWTMPRTYSRMLNACVPGRRPASSPSQIRA